MCVCVVLSGLSLGVCDVLLADPRMFSRLLLAAPPLCSLAVGCNISPPSENRC